jgi:hypothetical protein
LFEIKQLGTDQDLSWHLPGEIEKYHKNLSVPGIAAKILTEHPPNTRVGKHRCAKIKVTLESVFSIPSVTPGNFYFPQLLHIH